MKYKTNFQKENINMPKAGTFKRIIKMLGFLENYDKKETEKAQITNFNEKENISPTPTDI